MALVKYNNNSLSAITSTGLTAGAMTLIKEQTASSSATISFVDGTSDVVLDSTYPIYVFKFINIHPANDGVQFSFQANVAGGSGPYKIVKHVPDQEVVFEAWDNYPFEKAKIKKMIWKIIPSAAWGHHNIVSTRQKLNVSCFWTS